MGISQFPKGFVTEAAGGRAALLGRMLDGLPARELRRLRVSLGFVFQRHNLVPRLSVLSNVLHGALDRQGGPRFWSHVLAPAASASS